MLVVFREEEKREHWVVSWNEVDQLHSWVLELDYLGSNCGFIPSFLWSQSIYLILPSLSFLIFKIKLIGIVGETNEMMDITSLVVCMTHDKHLLSETVITEIVVKIITVLEVIASAPGCDCKKPFKWFFSSWTQVLYFYVWVTLTVFGSFEYLQCSTLVIQFK